MKKIVFATAILAGAGVVQAAESPEWNFVGLSYEKMEGDDTDPAGPAINGSVLLNENVFLAAGYSMLSDSYTFSNIEHDVDVDTLDFGIGYRHGITSNIDLYGVISYIDINAKVSNEFGSGKGSEDGYGLTAGVRAMVTDSVELAGAIVHQDVGDSDTGFNMSAGYYFNDQFSVRASLTFADLDSQRIGVYWHF